MKIESTLYNFSSKVKMKIAPISAFNPIFFEGSEPYIYFRHIETNVGLTHVPQIDSASRYVLEGIE